MPLSRFRWADARPPPGDRGLGKKVLTLASRISDVNTEELLSQIVELRSRGAAIGTGSFGCERGCESDVVLSSLFQTGELWHITCYLLMRVRDCGNPADVLALAKWPPCEMRETTHSPAQAGPVRCFFGRARPTERIDELLGDGW